MHGELVVIPRLTDAWRIGCDSTTVPFMPHMFCAGASMCFAMGDCGGCPACAAAETERVAWIGLSTVEMRRAWKEEGGKEKGWPMPEQRVYYGGGVGPSYSPTSTTYSPKSPESVTEGKMPKQEVEKKD
jgi:hypothetical protein